MALFTIYVYLQVVNYNHMMPTRYSVDISFDKTNINKELMKVRSEDSVQQPVRMSSSRASVEVLTGAS